MYVNKSELKKAKKELLGGLLSFASAYDDSSAKVNMFTGKYVRRGARGCKFHADAKSHAKYKKNLSGINLPALEHPKRLGVSEVGELFRHYKRSFNKYSQYKRLTTWQKIIYRLTLKGSRRHAFDDNLARCKEVHECILKRKREVLDTMRKI